MQSTLLQISREIVGSWKQECFFTINLIPLFVIACFGQKVCHWNRVNCIESHHLQIYWGKIRSVSFCIFADRHTWKKWKVKNGQLMRLDEIGWLFSFFFYPKFSLIMCQVQIFLILQIWVKHWYFVTKIVLTYCEKKLF